MSKDKMAGYPWKAGDPTKSATGIFIKDCDGRPILRVYSYPAGSTDDIERVARAVNACYGAGINPEAVKNLFNTCEGLLGRLEDAARVLEEYATKNGVVSYLGPKLRMHAAEIKAAIEKSTLK